MSELTREQLTREQLTREQLASRIAAEFDRRRWPYEPNFGEQLLGGLESGDPVAAGALAARVPAGYLERNRIERGQIEAVLGVLSGLTIAPTAEARAAGVVINDNRYQVNLSGSAQINDSNLNLGGEQITVSVEAAKEDVVGVLRLLIGAALGGDFNERAFAELGRVLEDRGDIDLEQIRAITVEEGAAQKSEPGRINQLLEKVATGALGGLLSTGLSAGLGELIANPPPL